MEKVIILGEAPSAGRLLRQVCQSPPQRRLIVPGMGNHGEGPRETDPEGWETDFTRQLHCRWKELSGKASGQRTQGKQRMRTRRPDQCPKCGVMDLDGPRGPGTLWKSTTVSSESRDPPSSAKRETTSEEPLRRRRAGLMGSGGNNRSSVPCPRSPGWEKAEAGLKLAVPRHTLLCVRQWGARETVGGGEMRQGRGGEQAGNVQKGVPAPERRALGHQR